jgi:hypothetical protein
VTEEAVMNERKRLAIGYLTIVVGLVVTLAGSVAVHMTQASDFDELGRELYPNVPRGWVPVTVTQSVAIGGVLLFMAGIWFAHIHLRKMTWSIAMLGALLFAALMLILFAVIPNQFLTLAQGPLDWTGQKIFVTIPPFLVLGNEIAISFATLKDMLLQGYVGTLLIGIPVLMYQIQKHSAIHKNTPPPTPVSDYGRPLRVSTNGAASNGASSNGSGV